jgi:hypothetical protein
MRIALLATPGPLNVGLSVLLNALLTTGSGGRQVFVDDDDATQAFLAAPPDGSFSVVSSYPRPELIAWIARQGMPMLVGIDALEPNLRHMMTATQLGPFESFRPITQSLALIEAAVAAPRRAIIGAQHLDTRVLAFATMLARITAGTVEGPEVARAAIASLGWEADAQFGAQIQRQIDSWFPVQVTDAVPRDVMQVMRAAHDPMVALVSGEDSRPVVWSSAFFYDGTLRTEVALATLDLLGPARCLYYGPYLHLPAGTYEGALTIGLSQDVGPLHLHMDIYTDRVEGEFRTVAEAGGMYDMPFEVTVTRAHVPIQLRLFNSQGEIDGRIGLLRAWLRRTSRGGPGAADRRRDAPNMP